jgi:propionate CoA-transferase
LIPREPKTMDVRIFAAGPMHVLAEWLSLPLESRLTWDPAEGVFFINFEAFSVRTADDIAHIRRAVETAASTARPQGAGDRQLRPLHHRARVA